MSTTTRELVGETTMVTNAEIANEVDDQRDKNRFLEESLAYVR